MCVCIVDVCVPGMSRWMGNCFWPKNPSWKLGSLLKEAIKLSCRHFAPLEQFSQCSKCAQCNFPSKQTSFKAIYLYGPDESALLLICLSLSAFSLTERSRLRSCTLNLWFKTDTDQTDWSNGQYFSPSCIFYVWLFCWAHSRIMFIPITWHSII